MLIFDLNKSKCKPQFPFHFCLCKATNLPRKTNMPNKANPTFAPQNALEKIELKNPKRI